ncbi:uncharacterized protein PADG_11076 [Paracoccidioides brasiliensis Pb18]|uniref:PiggyBac transposable element-derived protein domain-containing protein n=1 Tax=Paracoccidioides brasiliensis (strain Pb18) TaxID=502780 RepID=A0A0A0HX28_PARBD|nr:uncharacterized protein PADG_11076 [Paracoccidioides brasiliensis Pb18]KGM92626.1 hypothetical protein PADG_11076 [Paracoccidioides brasiliensis Pb18]
MPAKPIPQGYKVFGLAEHGYLWTFSWSSRRQGIMPMFQFPGITRTGSMVMNMIQQLPKIPIIRPTEESNTRPPTETPIIEASIIKALSTSEAPTRPSAEERPGELSTNAHIVRPVFENQPRKNLQIPKIIDDYNHNMNGGDLANQYRASYSSRRVSYRTWLPIFYWILDAAVVNAWRLHQVRRLDAQIDRIQLHISEAIAQQPAAAASLLAKGDDSSSSSSTTTTTTIATTIHTFATIARALSVGSPSHPLLTRSHLLHLLRQYISVQTGAEVKPTEAEEERNQERVREDAYITDLEWIVAAKATVQTLGLVMRALLEESLPLNDGIWYWDEVLSSHFYTGLYTMQTLPLRLWGQARDIFQTFQLQRQQPQLQQQLHHAGSSVAVSFTDRWRDFYTIVHQNIRERSLVRAKMSLFTPFALCRSQVRGKRKQLKKMREIHACAIGLLVEEGLVFEMGDESGGDQNAHRHTHGSDHYRGSHNDEADNACLDNLGDWKDTISRTVILLRTVLENISTLDDNSKITLFEDTIFTTVSHHLPSATQPSHIFHQLLHILETSLPSHHHSTKTRLNAHSYPSRLIRYWIPATTLLLSLGTVLNTLTNRREELWTWLTELGATTVDFGVNWVIDPLKRLVGTIRHDERSEVAIMSKASLEADRSSLERMVVDFAMDGRHQGTSWSQGDATADANVDADADALRAKVREGDLTPVLVAYERDLRRPFVGTVRGDLVRALLIQIQKTKVDVEIAMGGIDALLKSQELVFGFVGLTPGILVSYAVFSWIYGIFGNRAGLRRGKREGEMTRALNAVDRVLTASTTTQDGILSYKDHGLLIYETDILDQRAQNLLPGATYHEFKEDLNELLNVRVGVVRQLRVLERVRWTYAKWTR